MITNENEPNYRIADDDLYKSKEYGTRIYAKDIMLQTDGISAEIPVQSQSQTFNQKTKIGKIKYCSRCGGKINNETKKCTGCGKQYFKGFKGNKTLTILLIIMLVCIFRKNCASVPEERSAIPLETEQSSAS